MFFLGGEKLYGSCALLPGGEQEGTFYFKRVQPRPSLKQQILLTGKLIGYIVRRALARDRILFHLHYGPGPDGSTVFHSIPYSNSLFCQAVSYLVQEEKMTNLMILLPGSEQGVHNHR